MSLVRAIGLASCVAMLGVVTACQSVQYTRLNAAGSNDARLTAYSDATMDAEGRSLSFQSVDDDNLHSYPSTKVLYLTPGEHRIGVFYKHKGLEMSPVFKMTLESGHYLLHENGMGSGPKFWLVREEDGRPVPMRRVD
ncbi:MAG TPA: hypothetical protein VIM98_18585 [Dyella sp.]|uniref:hypothetical protein n=1 Tax=Dyella sp. TaxID=1869338 RepID=UPI002F924721